MNENVQKIHYETIHDDYVKHYYDSTSMSYREKFLYNYLFKGINLNDKQVADLACGSGYNSLYLKKYFPKAQLFGFDISRSACDDYEKLLNRPSLEADLTKENTFDQQFDCVMIIGGLHHCIADLNQTFQNVHQLLKPGGLFLMMEPNKRYILEGLRKLWYKFDRYFEANTEEALDHDLMAKNYSHLFECESVHHLGGPAYFLICNSLLFRIPLGLKKIIFYPLMFMEKIYNKLPGKFMYPYFIARWRKI